MLFLAIVSSISVLLVYYSFFTAIIFSALCIILMFAMNYKKQSGVLIFCGLWFLAVTLSTAHCVSDIERLNKMDEMTVSGEFVVVSSSESQGNGYSCVAKTIKSSVLSKGDKLQMVYNGPEIEEGSSFRANVTLKRLTGDTVMRSFYAENIYLHADASKIVLTNNNDFVLTKLNSVRKFIKNEIFTNFEKQEAATMVALLIGDRTGLSDSFQENVKGAGVAHVMVVSGMHLSIIVYFVLYLINKFMYNRILKSFIIFLTVFAIMGVCGFTMSILRAGITYLLVSLALAINRPTNGANNLGTALCVIMLFNPMAIFSVGLQLSVLSTFGIVGVALPANDFLTKNEIVRHKVLKGLVLSLLITVSALVLTLPVTIYIFGYISNMAVVSNLLISFVTTLAICLCVLGFVLFPIRSVVFYFSNIAVKYINSIINYCGGNDLAITKVPAFSVYIAVAIIFLIFVVLIACAKRDNMLKLKSIVENKVLNGGGKLRWQSFLKKRLKKQ